MQFGVILLSAAALLVGFCVSTAAEPMPSAAPSYPDSSRSALDWDGRYVGRLPCADCEAIETELTLSADGHYVLRTRYLGRSEDWHREAGRFVWDDRGQVVRLSRDGPDAKAFFVGENVLWQLDQSGQRIRGNLAERYQLHKIQEEVDAVDTPEPSASLYGTTWRLTALNGQPVVAREQPIHVEFVESEQRIQGFSGCNRFFGDVRLDRGTLDEAGGVAIAFSKMAMTRMACEGETHEIPFMQALQETRSALLNETQLVLFDASNRALASFAAD